MLPLAWRARRANLIVNSIDHSGEAAPALVFDSRVIVEVILRGFTWRVHVVPREVHEERCCLVVRSEKPQGLVAVKVRRVRGRGVPHGVKADLDVGAGRVVEIIHVHIFTRLG